MPVPTLCTPLSTIRIALALPAFLCRVILYGPKRLAGMVQILAPAGHRRILGFLTISDPNRTEQAHRDGLVATLLWGQDLELGKPSSD
jgi:hypothetical protein